MFFVESGLTVIMNHVKSPHEIKSAKITVYKKPGIGQIVPLVAFESNKGTIHDYTEEKEKGNGQANDKRIHQSLQCSFCFVSTVK